MIEFLLIKIKNTIEKQQKVIFKMYPLFIHCIAQTICIYNSHIGTFSNFMSVKKNYLIIII